MRFCIILILALSGCTSLPGVRNFSQDTTTLADSVDLIARDSGASCLRRLSLDAPIKGLTEENRKTYADVCNQLSQASELFISLNGTTRAYAGALAQLADNKLVSYNAEIAGAKEAIAKSKTDSPYVNKAQLNAIGSLAEVTLQASTDAFRQREIRRLLDHHEDLVQLAGVLETFIRRAYLPVLANEEANLDGLEEILKDRHLRTEPLRARELLELIKQQRVNLSERHRAANDALVAIGGMIATHSALHAAKPDRQELSRIITEYGQKIRDVRRQVQASFR